ncbi:MAG: polyprenyl synthetase family protein [Myxococcales bacterium]|nr:polyprenyl synthetase family protein [Myxococcales bacterium]
MIHSDLLRLAVELVNPSLVSALDRIQQRQSRDGPPTAHLVPSTLLEAIRYSLLAAGKRLRPALVLGGAQAVGANIRIALPPACAVEMVHAYSLIHDDLPALDDDDERRGQPSCHIQHGEATALLAGDALLTEAFAVLADHRPLSDEPVAPEAQRLQAVLELSRAIGAAGMIGGQIDDLAAENQTPDLGHLEAIHRRKTGRLIQASVVMGGIYGGGTEAQLRSLRTFGAELGFAFQLIDDVLDSDGIVTIQGSKRARSTAQELTDRALKALQPFGPNSIGLRELAEKMVRRLA